MDSRRQNMSGLSDLEELVVLCRSESSRKHLKEAILCYQAGAFRAAIIATWISVTFDLIEKFKELALAGDLEASQQISKLEGLLASQSTAGLLEFEKGLLDVASKKFEILSSLETLDLQRLLDDRHKCAHPSMHTFEELYSPPAELARSHIKTAVTHLLAREPAQGKAALERLIKEVESDYFPIELSLAVQHFEHGPLKHARTSLIRNFSLVLLKHLLTKDGVDFTSRKRYATAFNACRQMHRAVVEVLLAEKLSQIIDGLGDKRLGRAIAVLFLVSDLWDHLKSHTQVKLARYVEILSIEKQGVILVLATEIPNLRDGASKRLSMLEFSDLAQIIGQRPAKSLLPRALDLYLDSGSWITANTRAENLIGPLAQFFDVDNLSYLMSGAKLNSEVSKSFQFPETVEAIFTNSGIQKETFYKVLQDNGFGDLKVGVPVE